MTEDHQIDLNCNSIHLSIAKVPIAYQTEITSEKIEKYELIFLSKQRADEKDIAIVEQKSERIGWIVPAISMISSEHQRANCEHFHFFASVIFKKCFGQIFDERTYFLVTNKDKCKSLETSPESLLLNLIPYGIYPYYDNHSRYTNSLSKKLPEKISLNNNFEINLMKGYVRTLFHEILPRENNTYARFMYLYQFFELFFDLYYHAQINIMKIKKNHLGQIREKIADLSTEKKIITKIYEDAKLDRHDQTLSEKCYELLGSARDSKYYASQNKSAMIYDIRNTFVHNFHRFEMKDCFSTFFTDYLENEIVELISYIYSDTLLKSLFYDGHFEKTTQVE